MRTQQPLPQRGTAPNFRPISVVTTGWKDQNPLGREVPLCYMETQLALPKKGAEPPPIFGPCLLWPNGWMDQDATWYGGRPRGKPHCAIGGDPVCLPEKGHSSPQFLPHIYCGQTAGWIKMACGTEVGLGPGNIVPDGDPSLPPQRSRHSSPQIFGPCLLWPNGWMD